MKELLSRLSPDRPYNLHSHTQYCDGRAPMEEFARAAAATGFSHYAFTPHSPVPIESGCNMSMADVPAFLSEVKRLQSIYGGDTVFLSGMEIDYLSEEWGPSHPYFTSLDLDVRIGSVHFVRTQEGESVDIDGSFERFARNMKEKFHDDMRYVVDTFFDQTLAMIESGALDIVGHFDKIGYNGSLYQPGLTSTARYKDHIFRVINALARSGAAVEINTKAYGPHGRFFPEPAYWEELLRRDIPTVVNSDAHYPELINAGRPEALAILAGMKC